MSAIRSLIAVAAMASAGALAQDRPPKVGETRDLPKEPPAVSEKSVDPVRKSEPAADKPQDNPSKGQPAEKVDKPDQKSDSVKPNPTQDERNKARAKRRPVHAVIETMPRSGRSVSYGPVLNPVTPALVPPLPTVSPSSPVPIGTCMGGSCTDTNGTRYNGGVGTTLLSPTGRLCNNNGATVTCF